ncbi:Stellacyanin [Melia azedarach]|uniref:Stellacyanin n=1 Tax=Melia azedarach TaxID=155640 RepID=A0ACC1XPM4_MELAZ|nr:Stellacyanin [Melia azedarach]
MDTLEPHSPYISTKSESNSKPEIENRSSSLVSSPVPPPASMLRLWRPAAQRNLRNQWSKMASYRQQWISASSNGRSHATSLVNSYLSQRYMPSMELGVLSDMPEIRNKACFKLCKQQEHHRSKLLSSYKDMVAVVNYMVNISRSMRCFLKGPSSSPLVQFSSYSEDVNDTGDGGGMPVFVFLSVAAFEKLSEELVQMFELELNLKRLLVVELLATTCETPQVNRFCWSDELYPGEFDDLSICNLYSKETCEPIAPRLSNCNSGMPARSVQYHDQPNQEILQVYLTTWLAEVNIDTHRVNEIFAIIGEEMHVSIS